MNDTEHLPGAAPGWSPHFPHARIDALLAQLREAEDADLSEARELVLLVAEEAERLRRTVARLASSRLTEAEDEAARIISEAARTAHELRRVGRAALDARLAESEQLSLAVRDLIRVADVARPVPGLPGQRRPAPDPGLVADTPPADGGGHAPW